jgi:hypothetical protein
MERLECISLEMFFHHDELVNWATDDKGVAVFFLKSKNLSKAEQGKASYEVLKIYNCFD